MMTSELTEIKSNNSRDQLWRQISAKDTQRYFLIVDDPEDLLQRNEHQKVLLCEKLPVKIRQIYLKETPIKVEAYLRVEDQSTLLGILGTVKIAQ